MPIEGSNKSKPNALKKQTSQDIFFGSRLRHICEEFKRLLLQPQVTEVVRALQADEASSPFIEDGIHEIVERVLRSDQEACLQELQAKVQKHKAKARAWKELFRSREHGPQPDSGERIKTSEVVLETERRHLRDIVNTVGTKVSEITSFEAAHERLVRALQGELETVRGECRRLQQLVELRTPLCPRCSEPFAGSSMPGPHAFAPVGSLPPSFPGPAALGVSGSTALWQQQLQQQQQHYLTSLTAYSSALDEIHTRSHEVEAENQRLKAELTACNPLITRLTAQAEEANAELRRLQGEKERLAVEATQSAMARDSASQAQQRLADRMQQMKAEAARESDTVQQEMQRLAADCEAHAAAAEELRQRNHDLELELMHGQAESRALATQFNAEVQALCQQLAAVEADGRQAREAQQDSERRLQEREAEAAGMAEQVEQQRAALQAAHREAEQLREGLHLRQEAAEALEAKCAARCRVAEQCQRECEGLREELVAVTQSRNELRQELQALRQDAEARVRDGAVSLERITERLQAERMRWEREAETQLQKLRAVEEAQHPLQQWLREAEAAAAAATAALEAKTEDCEVLRMTVGRCSNEVAVANEEFSRVEVENLRLRREWRAAEERQRDALAAAEAATQEARRELAAVQARHVAAMEQRARAEAEATLLRDRCAELEDQLAEEKAATRGTVLVTRHEILERVSGRTARRQILLPPQSNLERPGVSDPELSGHVRSEGTQTDSLGTPSLQDSSAAATSPSVVSAAAVSATATNGPPLSWSGPNSDVHSAAGLPPQWEQQWHQLTQEVRLLRQERLQLLARLQQEVTARDAETLALERVQEAANASYEQRLLERLRASPMPTPSPGSVARAATPPPPPPAPVLCCTCPAQSLEAQLDKIQGKLERVTADLRHQRASPLRPPPSPAAGPPIARGARPGGTVAVGGDGAPGQLPTLSVTTATQSTSSSSSASGLTSRLHVDATQILQQPAEWSFMTDSSLDPLPGVPPGQASPG
eukprot:EG_transcript_1897